jgi:hypothetical protein
VRDLYRLGPELTVELYKLTTNLELRPAIPEKLGGSGSRCPAMTATLGCFKPTRAKIKYRIILMPSNASDARRLQADWCKRSKYGIINTLVGASRPYPS